MPWDYIIDSSLWSIAGLAAGYVLGRAERSILKRKKKTP